MRLLSWTLLHVQILLAFRRCQRASDTRLGNLHEVVGAQRVDANCSIRAARYAERLYSSAFQQSYLSGMELWIASIDAAVLSTFRRWYEFQLGDVGATLEYLGSPTTPVAMWLQEQYDHYAAHRPDLFQRLFVGDFIDIRDAEASARRPVGDGGPGPN